MQENSNQENSLPKDFYVKLRNTPDMEEKIDYIYAALKSQKRMRYFWLLLKILFFVSIIYFLIYMPPEVKWDLGKKVQDVFTQKIVEISQPIIQETLKNTQWWVMNQENIDATLENPRVNELLEKFKQQKQLEKSLTP